MDMKQVVGLIADLATRLKKGDFAAAGSVLAANTIGTPSSITIPDNGVLVRTSSGFSGLQLLASTVLARGATGDVAALTFSAFKTALAIGDGDLALTQNFIFVGNASGKAAGVNPNTLPINVFAAPNANMSLGNFTFLSNAAIGDIPNNGLITKAQATQIAADAVSTGGGFAAPYHGTLTAGSMTLATLPSAPTDAANALVYVNGQYLHQGAGKDYTISGAILTATSSLNVAWGGTGTDGQGFASTDRITVHYR